MQLFGTDGIRGKVNAFPITGEIALRLGKAVSYVLSHKNSNSKHKIAIGKDTRLSGYMLETALTSGIVSMGCNVLLIGPMPTPGIAYLTKSLGADAGIVLSASHNPAHDNGIKIFDSNGLKLNQDIEKEIEELVLGKELEKMQIPPDKIGKAFRVDDAKQRYKDFLIGQLKNKSLKGLKVVMDCANGAAYKIGPSLLLGLGAEVIAIKNEPDGFNINQECGAIAPQKMAAAVKEHNADIGIALDGDADRIIVSDEKGNLLEGEHLLALFALDMKEKGLLNKNRVVTTPHSNLGFTEAMKENGIDIVIAPVGDRYVLEEMRKRNASLGGEQCGHMMFSSHKHGEDALLTGLRLMELILEKGKKLSELASIIKIYPQKLVNVLVREKKPIEELPSVQERIKEAEKALGKEGRVFVRYSGTEKIARVMVEGREEKQVTQLAESIADAFRKEVGVGEDTTAS